MMFFGNGVYFLRDNLIQEMSTCFRMHLPVGHDTFEKKKVKIYPSRRSKSLISLRNQYNNGKGRTAKFSRLFSKTFPFPTKKSLLTSFTSVPSEASRGAVAGSCNESVQTRPIIEACVISFTHISTAWDYFN